MKVFEKLVSSLYEGQASHGLGYENEDACRHTLRVASHFHASVMQGKESIRSMQSPTKLAAVEPSQFAACGVIVVGLHQLHRKEP